jgi:hypothetical protein
MKQADRVRDHEQRIVSLEKALAKQATMLNLVMGQTIWRIYDPQWWTLVSGTTIVYPAIAMKPYTRPPQ